MADETLLKKRRVLANERFFTGRKFDQPYRRSLHNSKGSVSYVLFPSGSTPVGFYGAVVARRRKDLARANTAPPRLQESSKAKRELSVVGSTSKVVGRPDTEEEEEIDAESQRSWSSTTANDGSQEDAESRSQEFCTPPTQPVEEDVEDSEDEDDPSNLAPFVRGDEDDQSPPQDPVLSWDWDSVVSTPNLSDGRRSRSFCVVKKLVPLQFTPCSKLTSFPQDTNKL